MDTPKTEQGKPHISKRKKMLLFLICLICFFFCLSSIGQLVSVFFDIYSLFPLKTYIGKEISLGYPQNWRVFGSGDDITIEPQSTLLGFPEPEEYIFNDMYIVTQPATSSSTPGEAAEEQRKWEQRISQYKPAQMPQAITIGGTSWIQLAATYVLVSKDGTTVPVEEVALSTVHKAKDGSYLSFLMVFNTDPNIFDRMYQQVLQRIFHSFAFR